MFVSRWLLVAAVILVSQTAEAQQQNALTLSCKGTTTWFPTGSDANGEKPEDVSMGIIFNFTTGEVAGFDDLLGVLGLGSIITLKSQPLTM